MKKNLKNMMLYVSILFTVSVMMSGLASADNDAMDYVAAPPGTSLAIFYYSHISANESYNSGTKTSSDANLQQNVGIIRGVHYMKLGNFTIDPQFLLPFADATIDGAAFGNEETSATGLGDLIITSTFWLIDDQESKTWLGFTPFIFIPTGDYDEDRALNIGSNRWSVKPEIGFSKGFDKWHIDLTAAVQFFEDNDEFIGNSTKAQDPEFTLESHLTYKWTDTFNTSLSWFHHREGETSINGSDQGDELDNHRLGAAFSWWLTPQHQLILKYYRDVEVEAGSKQDLVGLRFLYAF